MHRKWLRIGVYVVGGFVALVLTAAAAIMFFLPTAGLVAQIERAVEQASGRDLTIAGRTSFTFYPVLGVKARDVTLSNVPGGASPHFAKAQELDVGVALMPLLRGQIEVRRLVLVAPDIALEIDAEGRGNWLFRPPAPPPPSGPAPPPAGGPPPPPPEPPEIRVSDVQVQRGRVSLRDARGGGVQELTDVNLRARMDSLDQPATMQGAVIYRGESVALEVVIGNPRAVHAGASTPLSLKLGAAPLTLDFDGQMNMRAGDIRGSLKKASGASLRGLAAWVGAPIGPGQRLEAFEVAGELAFDGRTSTFTNASFTIDDVTGRGDFTIETGRARPYVSGRLEAPRLDLNPYLAPNPAVASAAAASPMAEAAAAQAAGVNAEAPWSDLPFELPGLKAVDANLEITLSQLQFQRLKIDRAMVSFVLNEGRLAATLSDLAMYGGRGKGRLELDASQPFVRFVQELDVDGVQAQAFLADAVGWRGLGGQALVQMRLSGGGANQRALISSLGGFSRLQLRDGAVTGVDLGGVARNVRNVMAGDLIGPQARTAFNSFTVSFTVADGVAATDDLRLATPNAQIALLGVLDLGQQLVDMRVNARTVIGHDRRTGAPNLSAFTLPFRATGRWTDVRYSADLLGGGRRPVEQQVRDTQARARAAQTR